MNRRLKIDLSELEFAFDNSGSECVYHLNLESGEVLFVTDEMQSAFANISEVAEIQGLQFDEALAMSDLADWMKDAVAQVAVVEEGEGSTIVAVPEVDSRDAFRDMEDFVESVRDVGIKGRLLGSLSGNRPFRRFKDAIAAYQQEEVRWFAFRDERVRQRVLDWLEEEGIELID